uniref:Tetratricopeptide repeat protein n=1 Tax=Eubacterium cellulosolvens (strain ATCC 43171 / JCM 9499 / 6) TaxID=633697 RepID=I5ASV1_EUBC6
MSNAILCQVKRAENPYYIREVDLRIYSVEELCFFIDKNLPLVDEEFFSEELIDWLAKELKLRRLVQTMERIRQEEPDNAVAGQILAVNQELSWLYAGDKEKLKRNIEEVFALPILERRVRRADILVGYQKYAKAIEAYKAILADGKVENPGQILTGRIYHNTGIAYSRLFQFDEASSCLKKAYDLLHTLESLKDYLYCLWISGGKEEFTNACREYEVDAKTRREMEEELESFDSEAGQEEEEDVTEDTLNTLVREYHRQTGC